MAVLTDDDRSSLWAEFMRRASRERASLDLTKPELRDAVDALDVWIEDNQGAINTAIPLPARTALSASQKVLLFFFVADKRFEVL